VAVPFCSATYVGPSYATSRHRILFVGKDQGLDNRSYDAKASRDWILKTYRENGDRWSRGRNRYTVGCIRVAAEILDLAYKLDCLKKCSLKPEKDCVLCNYAKGNAVRCVECDKKSMACESDLRVEKCFRYIFKQLPILRPEVLILQGRNKGTGHIHEDFKNELERGDWGSLDMLNDGIVGTITWRGLDAYDGPAVVAFLQHPSAHYPFEKTWRAEVLPAIERIRSLLANK
jgi:hypothetical protein